MSRKSVYKSGKPRKQKRPLPLIGTNYKWYDSSKGVGGTNREDTIPQRDLDPRVSGKKYFRNKNVQYRWYTDPTFSGDHEYNYRKINPQDIYYREKGEKLQRASYIPYVTSPKGNYWLLGSFHDFPDIKVDFGGACQGYETPDDCATRELNEETQRVLLTPVKNAIAEGKVTVFKGRNKDPKNNKSVFIIMVNIDDHFDTLDEIQKEINKRFSQQFVGKTPDRDDLFGPLGFYLERNLFNFRNNDNSRLHTSFNMTDFIRFYRNRKETLARYSQLN